MGLYMKKIKTTLLLTVAGIALCACMKTPEINKDFGPEVPAESLKDALNQAQIESTYLSVQNIKQGEFAYTEKTSQIENLYPIVFRQRGDTVSKKVEDEKKIMYTITRELRELDSAGHMQGSHSSSDACLAKTHGGCDQKDLVGSTAPDVPSVLNPITMFSVRDNPSPPPDFGIAAGHLQDLSWRAITTHSGDSIHWTYHKLRKIYSSINTPSLVQMRPDCGGRKNPCSSPMQTVEVRFDEVDWTTEKYPVKYSYVLIFSPEAPFFASQVMSCGSTTVPFRNQRVALLQCETVKDFTAGHDTP